METKLNMIYWRGEKFWVGKLLEHPEIMTQGKTLKAQKKCYLIIQLFKRFPETSDIILSYYEKNSMDCLNIAL